MLQLEDFIYQGTLPFVGREAELARLLAFWRATPRSQRLRAALVVAEAGIGKSRLLDEVMRTVVESGGAVVHAKLYPEAALSLAPILAGALWHSNAGRELLRSEPEGKLASVVAALRRLCRLRPTLLVIEDAHLLVGESAAELSALLNALVDETISALVLCRPIEWKGHGVLEPYLVERIELEGLDEESIATLWQQLFGDAGDRRVVDRIHRVTLGNGLAVRSSFRMALDSGYILHDDGRAPRHVERVEGAFMQMLERSVGLLSEGMVMHLSDAERQAAGHLAALGEVFSHEAAARVIDAGESIVATLIEKGILATSTISVAPMPGVTIENAYVLRPLRFAHTRRPLLAFTHTLLHRHFLDRVTVDSVRLFRVVAEDLPLYSLLPIQLLKDVDTRSVPIDLTIAGVERILAVSRALDDTSEWRSALEIFDIGNGIVESRIEEIDDPRWWRARLYAMHQWLQRRTMSTAYRRTTTAPFLELTVDPATRNQAAQRLFALQEALHVHWQSQPTLPEQSWRESIEILERFPDLRTTAPYVGLLGALVICAGNMHDWPMLERIQHQVEEMLQVESDPGNRIQIQLRIYPDYLLIYHTAEELENRRRLFDALQSLPYEYRASYEDRAVDFLLNTGELEEMARLVDAGLPRARQQGHVVKGFVYSINRMVADVAFGASLESTALSIRQRVASMPESMQKNMRIYAMQWMPLLGILRGDPAWGEEMLRELIPDAAEQHTTVRFYFDVADHRYDQALSDLRYEPPPHAFVEAQGYTMFETLLGLLLGDVAADRGAIREVISLWIAQPPMRIWNVAALHSLITLVEAIGHDERYQELAASLHDLLAEAIVSRMQWLDARGLFAFMAPLLDLHGEYLPAKARTAWRERIDALRAARSPGTPENDKVRVSMLGTISVGHGAELEPLRGVRIRTLLGLLVADQMIGRTLTPKEFVQIAGGGDDDNAELARKKRNMGVVRLREIMGQDAILTDEKTPRLNLDRVEVDLLRADELIKRSLAAAREGSLVRAHPLLVEALEVTRGEVPFPTLYETFFEAAREDFEYRLRSAIVDISQGLLREGDGRGAEEVLRRGFAAMPDDGEISELLQRALVSRGNRMEAERIKMQTSAT